MSTSDDIEELLNNRNIKKVIYVDDDLEIGPYKEGLAELLRKNFQVQKNACPFPFDALDIRHALKELDNWIDNDRMDVVQFIHEHNIERKELEIETRLKELLPEDKLQTMSPSEFSSFKESVSKQTFLGKKDQYVILMDKFIDQGDPNSGKRLLGCLENKKNFACGLFSRHFSIEEELKEWKEEDPPSENIYPLSKSRLDPGKERLFLSGLRNVLWLRAITDVKKNIVRIYQKALETTEKNFNSLDPASFDQAIIQSSKKEGCWEFDTVKRIVQLLLENDIECSMIKEYHEFQTLTRLLKSIPSYERHEGEPDSELLKNYYYSEIYADGNYVNGVFSQIANGDIFEIEKNGNKKRYILSCQPCNLALRKQGKRKSGEFVFLLPLEKRSDKSKEGQKFYSVIKTVEEPNETIANLAAFVRIHPSILDLVSFNKEGRAAIDLRKTSKKLKNAHVMQENMLKCYDKIHAEVKKHLKLWHRVKKAVDEKRFGKEPKESLIGQLENPFEMADKNLVSVELTGSVLDFNVTRVKRYKEPFSQMALSDFMSYLCRQALPNDFSN